MSSRDINKLKETFRASVKELIRKANNIGIPAFVTDTTRTLAEQKELVRKGLSWTLESKHLTGEAADIAFNPDGPLSYDAKMYKRLYKIVKDIPYIIWPYKDLGWRGDKPHFQYDPSKKPKSELIKQVNSLFRSVWGRQPKEKESRYFQYRVAGGVHTEEDLLRKMRFWHGLPRFLFILEMQRRGFF
ncbi:hypothetical protein LCGC14_0417980 [marine sediment metagenome]|uniref:Peptidase M15C domain-containing protein n=1 Tax=marine sediment metagenome TaxID=412755 RepID=A0A0F9T9V0_9ZZZZ